MSSKVLILVNTKITFAGLEESLNRIVSSLIPGESQICEGVCLSRDGRASLDGTAEISEHAGGPNNILLDADSIAKSQPGPDTKPLESLNASVSQAVDPSTADPLSAAEEGI